MNNLAVILGSIIILACAICLFTYGASENLFRIIIGCILIFMLIVIVTTFIKNQSSLRIHGIFLTYSTHFIRDRPLTLLYIPLFLLFLIAFIIMIVLEFSSFWTTGDLSFSSNEGLFHKPVGVGPIVLSVFVGIQAVWGLVFLKMACNYMLIKSISACQVRQCCGTIILSNLAAIHLNCSFVSISAVLLEVLSSSHASLSLILWWISSSRLPMTKINPAMLAALTSYAAHTPFSIWCEQTQWPILI